jgi:hypothetical protein
MIAMAGPPSFHFRLGACGKSEPAGRSHMNTATTTPETNVRAAIEPIAAESPNLSAMMPADAPIA